MTSPSSLYGLARELLDVAIASLGADPPKVSWVSIGDPPNDGCNLVTVHVPTFGAQTGMWSGGAGAGLGALRADAYGSVNVISLTITIIRCVSIAKGGGSISVPTAAAMDTDAQRSYRDGWRIWNGVRTALHEGRLWTTYSCRNVELGPAIPIAPAGGGAGWTINVITTLDGYLEEGAS